MDYLNLDKITPRKIFYAGIFAVSTALAYFDFPEVFLYFIFIYFVFALFVSMLVEGWKNNQKILVETENEKFVTYVNGVRVEDPTRSLRNLHFLSLKSMRNRYLMLLSLKMAVGIYLCYELVKNLLNNESYSILVLSGIAIFSTVFFAVRLYINYRSLMVALRNQWEIHNYELDGAVYGAAYIKNGAVYVSFLNEVFR